MRKAIGALAVLMAAVTAAFAQDPPDLIGRWTIAAEGMSISIPGGEPAVPVHADSVFVIDKQDGFRISGHEMNQRAEGTALFSGEERFAGIIGTDNRTVSMIDENGFRDCDIVSPKRMECIYRHVASTNAVVTRNTWTKQSD